MIEIKMRNNIVCNIEGSGEFALSRSAILKLASRIMRAAVIAGTMRLGGNPVFVNARLIRATDNLVLASYDYVLPNGAGCQGAAHRVSAAVGLPLFCASLTPFLSTGEGRCCWLGRFNLSASKSSPVVPQSPARRLVPPDSSS